MHKNEKKTYGVRRGKGHLAAEGPQARFILFLILVLVAYTLLLKVFQKIAAIVDLPLFVPIALISLFVFVGIAGTLYSHRFVGPLVRIRKTLEHVANGDCSVSLRLRDSDDPMLKDLARTIEGLCEQGRNTHYLVRDAAQNLFQDLAALEVLIQSGAPADELRKQVSGVQRKKDLLEQAIRTMGK
jgi:nitrogen fixation/metabolism regulation signal transduction histidine kinase